MKKKLGRPKGTSNKTNRVKELEQMVANLTGEIAFLEGKAQAYYELLTEEEK